MYGTCLLQRLPASSWIHQARAQQADDHFLRERFERDTGQRDAGAQALVEHDRAAVPVSYTHLTLPTKRIV